MSEVTAHLEDALGDGADVHGDLLEFVHVALALHVLLLNLLIWVKFNFSRIGYHGQKMLFELIGWHLLLRLIFIYWSSSATMLERGAIEHELASPGMLELSILLLLHFPQSCPE